MIGKATVSGRGRELWVGGDSDIHNVSKVVVIQVTGRYSGVGLRWVKPVWAFQPWVVDCHLNNELQGNEDTSGLCHSKM